MGLFSGLFGSGSSNQDDDGTLRDDEGEEIWVPPAVKNRPEKVQEFTDAHYQSRSRRRWTDSQPDGAMDELGSVLNHERSAASNSDGARNARNDRERASYTHYTDANVDKAQESLGRMRDKVQETRNKRLQNGGEDRL